MPPDKVLNAAAQLLRQAKRVCILTGAGVSAESGVPTFRDAQKGLWARYDPHELATAEAFVADPDLVWSGYAWPRKLVSRAEPNTGHLTIAELQSLIPELTLITQNVDGLHQRASSSDVIEFHGNLFENSCFERYGDLSEKPLDADAPQCPLCPQCGARVRRAVVWFGEQIPVVAMVKVSIATSRCDGFFSVGTSASVWPAAGLADMARQNCASLVEINLDPTSLSDSADISLHGKAGEILPQLVEALKQSR